MKDDALSNHLAAGTSDVVRCWRLTRSDGVSLGFTDHDVDISFDGQVFKANSGLTAAALSQTTGLSVDNSEALGALSDAAIRETDVVAGRFDGARIEAWHVCWSDPNSRALVFRGTLGELTRTGQAFSAELRGLSETLNQPTGRVYHKSCSCILGDKKCGIDLNTPGYHVETALKSSVDNRLFYVPAHSEYEARWFERGTLDVVSGMAVGLFGVIKNDRIEDGLRRIELWAPLGSEVAENDVVRLTAGCDKTMPTCKLKFSNLMNFRGFPDIPGDDWLVSSPARAWVLNGGSRR
ncbi:MAG: DUF2163 domain-containing protein [Pseudomonadota bacterium]